MGKVNKDLFEQVFGDGRLEVEVKERHQMFNKPIVHKNKKKYNRAKERKEVNYDSE